MRKSSPLQSAFGVTVAATANCGSKFSVASRWFRAHPEARFAVLSVYLEEGRGVKAAYTSLLRQASKFNLSAAELPSYETVRCWLASQEVPAPIKCLAREGEKTHNEKMLPYLSRSYRMPPNKIWVSDHMIHDVMVRNDCFLDLPANTAMRKRSEHEIALLERELEGVEL